MPFFEKIQHGINGKEMKMIAGLKKWRKRQMLMNFWTCLKVDNSCEVLATSESLGTVMVQIDFSENFSCIYQDELSRAH